VVLLDIVWPSTRNQVEGLNRRLFCATAISAGK
jgi:hypothetical protein